MRRLIAPLIALACGHALAASPFAGEWVFVARTPDRTYGEPDALTFRVRVQDGAACGSFISAWRGGMRVAEGFFRGQVHGSRINLVYDAGWGAETGEGRGTLSLRNGVLHWKAGSSGPGQDYMIRAALLKRAASEQREIACE